MHTLHRNANHYLVDGAPAFLVSGEFHYFRVPKADWAKRLSLFKEAGGNCVATYIPWILHEPTEGDFRLGDMPYRDLEGFLTLCREMDIWVVARPGPYQYSEMKYCGLPEWLCEGYPEILAQGPNGKPLMGCSVSYLHELFLEKTKRWFDFICPVIARHTVQKGGAVVFAQFDNELMGIHEWFGGWDFNPVAMGFGRDDGRYTVFLQKRYGDIALLNEAYEGDYRAFTDVSPTKPPAAGSFGALRMARDYQRFYFEAIAEYADILSGWMISAGIDCELIHNAANPSMVPYFIETLKRRPCLLGVDLYYNLNLDFEANSPSPKLAAKALIGHEMLRLMGFPSTVLEMQAGCCSDWPPILPGDLRCWYLMNVAFGMKGVNYYVFTGGPNPEKIGGDGPMYDYCAAIAPDGELRPAYAMLKSFGVFLTENPWLAESERVCDVAIGIDYEYSRSKYIEDGFSGFGGRDAWEFLNKGLLLTTLCASLSPEMVDLCRDDFIETLERPLFIAAAERLAEDVQRRLIRFVQRGGKLWLSPVIPSLDESYRPCTLLADFLGAGASVAPEKAGEVCVGEIENAPVGALRVCEKLPEGAVLLATLEKDARPAAWIKQFGQGAVLWSGLSWKHAKHAHLDMLRFFNQQLGGSAPAVRCDNPAIWVTLRKAGSRQMLFIMNLFSAKQTASIAVLGEDGTYGATKTFTLQPMEVLYDQLEPIR